jgi:hypothetical protein
MRRAKTVDDCHSFCARFAGERDAAIIGLLLLSSRKQTLYQFSVDFIIIQVCL